MAQSKLLELRGTVPLSFDILVSPITELLLFLTLASGFLVATVPSLGGFCAAGMHVGGYTLEIEGELLLQLLPCGELEHLEEDVLLPAESKLFCHFTFIFSPLLCTTKDNYCW